MKRLVREWIKIRYGGAVYALKPPIGYHPLYCPRTFLYRRLYHLKHGVWRVENWLFKRYGQPIRDAWKASL